MSYTFSKTADGNVQVSENGKAFTTTTPQNASMSFGYIDPTPNAPKPAKEVGVVSSQQGADTIAQKTKQLSSLTPVPVNNTGTDLTKTTKTDTAVPSATKITLLNPTTGQQSIFEDADLNKQNIQNLMSSGYQVSETSGNLPSWLVAGSIGSSNSAQSKAQLEMDQASADLKSLTDNLTKYTVSDEQLKGQIDAITSQWDARINDMKRVNTSREAAISTTGVRLGSRYSGGNKGGVFGGIISEEERQGIARIGELEANKQSAIAAARAAAASQNWQVYSKQVDIAQKAYTDKIDALKELNKATIEQNKLIADKIKDNEKQYFDTVTKPINDIVASLSKSQNLVPPEIIDAVANASSLAEAVKAAGSYLNETPSATGIVGEYLFYKKEAEKAGQSPVDFNTYQNMDANRKARATANASGIAPATLSKVQQIAGSFDNEAIVKQYNTIAENVAGFKSLGSSPTDDISRIYTFAKVMDPNSAVKEGEYDTVQEYAQTLLEKTGLKVARVFDNRGFLTPEARTLMESTLQKKLDASDKTYKNVYNEYGRRINKITGGKDGTDYITDYSKGYETANNLIKTEAQAEERLKTLVADPAKATEVNSKISAMEKSLGKAISAQDFLQAFPEYNQ